MIPNSAPLAAVYRKADGTLTYTVIAAFADDGAPCISTYTGLAVCTNTDDDMEFLGLVQGTWSPSHQNMASLLENSADPAPEPHRQLLVRIVETADGWTAYLVRNGETVDTRPTLWELEHRLAELGSYTTASITRLADQ